MTAAEIATLVSEAVADGAVRAGCTPDRVTYTFAEPPAPAGQCSAVWIWVDRIERDAAYGPCEQKPLVTVKWRVDWCYPSDRNDLRDEDHRNVADCFVDLYWQIWCAVAAISVECDLITSGTTQTTTPSGGIVSAGGEVSITGQCDPPPEQED